MKRDKEVVGWEGRMGEEETGLADSSGDLGWNHPVGRLGAGPPESPSKSSSSACPSVCESMTSPVPKATFIQAQ